MSKLFPKAKVVSTGKSDGQISSSVTYRSSSGTKTTKDAEGNVVRVEEKVTLDDGAKGIRTTTYAQNPNLNVAPGTNEVSTNAYYDAQGRKLTPLESIYLQSYAGGASRVKGGTFGLEGEEVYYTLQREKPNITPYNINRLRGEQFVSEVIRKENDYRNKLNTINTRIQTAIDTGNKRDLVALQNQRAELIKERQLTKKPAYGTYEPLAQDEKLTTKRFLSQGAGIVSRGFELIGTGATYALQDVKERDQLRLNQGNKNYFEKRAIKNKIIFNDIGQGIVSGGVTKIGTDKTTALIYAGAGVVGGIVGASKQAFTGVKLFTLTPKALRATQLAGKGIRTGLIVGTVGIVGTSIALSDEPAKTAGELAGAGLVIGTTYTAGSNAGTGLVKGVQTARLNTIANRINKIKPGTALTTQQAKDVGTYVRLSRATGKGGIPIGQEVKGVNVRSIKTQTPKKGVSVTQYRNIYGDKVIIGKTSGSDYVKIDYTNTKLTQTNNLRLNAGQLNTNKLLAPTSTTPGQTSFIGVTEKGKGYLLTKDFNNIFLNPNKQNALIIQTAKTTPTSTATYYDFTGKVTGYNFPKPSGVWSSPQGQITRPLLEGATVKALPPSYNIFSIQNNRGITILGQQAGGKPFIIFQGIKPATSVKPYVYPGSEQTATILQQEVIELGTISETVSTAKTAQQTAKTAQQTKTTTQAFNDLGQTRSFYAPQQYYYKEEYTAPKAFTKSFYESPSIKPTSDIQQGVTPTEITTPKPTTTTIVTPRIRSGSRSGSTNDFKLNSDTSTSIDYAQAQGTTPVIDTTTDTISRLDIGSDTTTNTRTTTTGLTFLTPRTPPPGTPKPPKPVPKLPPRKFKGRDFGQQGGLFQAFTRVKGKFTFIGTPTTSKRLAFGAGAKFVERTPSRTFGVANISETKSFRGVDLDGGSDYKKKRGRFGLLFIEPSRRAINTGGELSGITFKGISKSKSKGGFL